MIRSSAVAKDSMRCERCKKTTETKHNADWYRQCKACGHINPPK